jgi:hypothetical protein
MNDILINCVGIAAVGLCAAVLISLKKSWDIIKSMKEGRPVPCDDKAEVLRITKRVHNMLIVVIVLGVAFIVLKYFL